MGFYSGTQKDILNKTTMEGFSYSRRDTMMPFLSDIIVASMRGLKDDIDIEYLGYSFLTPMQIVEYIKKSSKPMYDINVTQSVYVELHFMFKGEATKDVIFQLPYISKYSITKYKGTEFYLSPVLTDLVISPSANEVFIRPQSDNIVVKSKNILIKCNDLRVPTHVIYSDSLLRNKSPDNIGGKPVVPLIVYDCIYNGWENTLKKHGVHDVQILKEKLVTAEMRKTHDIYTSTGNKPKMHKSETWTAHGFAIAVSKGSNSNQYIHQLIVSLLYILDILGDNRGSDLVDVIVDKTSTQEEEKYAWIFVAGDLYYKLSHTPDFRIGNMIKHLNYLEGYLDAKTNMDLKYINVNVKSFPELLCYVTENFHTLTSNAKKYTNTINTRYLDSNYYILYAYIVGINYSFRDINNNAHKTKNIKDIFRRNLLNVKFKTNVLNVHMVECSGDSLFFKTGVIQELQERGNGVLKAGGDRIFPYNSRELGGLDPVIGNILYLAKNYPTAKAKINPASRYDSNGRFTPTKPEKKLIKLLDTLFSDNTNDNKFAVKQIEENDIGDTIDL